MTSFDDLFGSTPLIPDDIYKEWTGIASQNNISIPRELTSVITDKHIDTDIYADNPVIVNNEENDPNNPSGVANYPNGVANDPNRVVNAPNGVQNVVKNHKKQDSKTRGIVYEPIFDINKFSDGRMKYEMYRFERN